MPPLGKRLVPLDKGGVFTCQLHAPLYIYARCIFALPEIRHKDCSFPVHAQKTQRPAPRVLSARSRWGVRALTSESHKTRTMENRPPSMGRRMEAQLPPSNLKGVGTPQAWGRTRARNGKIRNVALRARGAPDQHLSNKNSAQSLQWCFRVMAKSARTVARAHGRGWNAATERRKLQRFARGDLWHSTYQPIFEPQDSSKQSLLQRPPQRPPQPLDGFSRYASSAVV